jgi:hypothetical protein
VNAYPVALRLPNGQLIEGEVVTDMTIPAAIFANGLLAQVNGFIYTGAVPTGPPWTSNIPNALNQTGALAINLTTYNPTATSFSIAFTGSHAGWTFDGTHTVNYDGSTVNGASFTFQATGTLSGFSTQSNVVTCQGAGSGSTDTTAPTIPLNVAASLITQTTATLSWNQSTDNQPPATTASNLGNYTVHVKTGGSDISGSPFSVSPGGTQVIPSWTVMDRGTQTSSIVQGTGSSGNDLQITTTATDAAFPTSVASGGGGFQVNAAGLALLVFSCEIDAFTSTNAFDNIGLEISSSLAVNAQQVAIRITPTNGSSPDVLSQYVPSNGGSLTAISTVSNPGLPIRLFITFAPATNTYAFFWSNSGNVLNALGSVVVAMGATLLLRAVGNNQNPGSITATLKQLTVSTLPQASLALTGLTVNTTYSVTSLTAQDLNGTPNVSASAAAVTFTTAAAGPVFPIIGVQFISGNQFFPPGTANANDIAASQFQWIELGGDFDSWPSGSTRTRQAVVTSLKGQSGLGGKNAVVPQVFQYCYALDMNPSAPEYVEWYNICNSNNWWCYEAGSSGTKLPGVRFNGSPATISVNPAHVVGTDTTGAYPGLYPFQVFAAMMYKRFILGTLGTAGNAAASLDGILVDNMSVRNQGLGATGDWLRTGTAQSNTDPTAIAACTLGKADLAYFSTLSGKLTCINTQAAADTAPSGQGGSGLNGNNLKGVFSYPMQQFVGSTKTSPNNSEQNAAVLNWGGQALGMDWIQIMAGFAKSGSAGVCSCAINTGTTDAAVIRNFLTAMLMTNQPAMFGTQFGDSCDYSAPANLPTADEFWGASLSLAGYLGAQASSSQGNPQTVPTITAGGDSSAMVWCRDFANGTAYWNPTSVSKTITLLRSQYRLNGSSSVNTGGGAITTLTIAAKDGQIMMDSKPP